MMEMEEIWNLIGNDERKDWKMEETKDENL